MIKYNVKSLWGKIWKCGEVRWIDTNYKPRKPKIRLTYKTVYQHLQHQLENDLHPEEKEIIQSKEKYHNDRKWDYENQKIYENDWGEKQDIII